MEELLYEAGCKPQKKKILLLLLTMCGSFFQEKITVQN